MRYLAGVTVLVGALCSGSAGVEAATTSCSFAVDTCGFVQVVDGPATMGASNGGLEMHNGGIPVDSLEVFADTSLLLPYTRNWRVGVDITIPGSLDPVLPYGDPDPGIDFIVGYLAIGAGSSFVSPTGQYFNAAGLDIETDGLVNYRKHDIGAYGPTAGTTVIEFKDGDSGQLGLVETIRVETRFDSAGKVLTTSIDGADVFNLDIVNEQDWGMDASSTFFTALIAESGWDHPSGRSRDPATDGPGYPIPAVHPVRFDNYVATVDNVGVVPVPASVVLLLSAAGLLGFCGRRRNASKV